MFQWKKLIQIHHQDNQHILGSVVPDEFMLDQMLVLYVESEFGSEVVSFVGSDVGSVVEAIVGTSFKFTITSTSINPNNMLIWSECYDKNNNQ